MKKNLTLTQWRKYNHTPTNKELIIAIQKYKQSKNWYKQSKETVKKRFPHPSDYTLFLKLLAATSQQNNLEKNVNLALQAYTAIKEGFDPLAIDYGIANPPIQRNIKRILNGEYPQGNKIKPFTLALLGDLTQVVIDTHILLLLRPNKNRSTKKVSPSDIKHINYIIRKLSKETDLMPSEVQACLWVYTKLTRESSREKNDFDYSHYLNPPKSI